MADVGLLDITADPKLAPKTQMPGAIPLTNTPQAVAAPTPKTNLPVANPPNVNGGAASFSDVTTAIQDLAASKKAEIDASIDALKANTAVDTQASSAISGYQTQAIDSFTNVQKAESLPGGAGGKLAKIIGIFDSTYNVPYQETQAKIAQMKATSIANTAEALKTQNNALPTLLSKVSEATKVVYDAQMEANKLFLQGQELKDKQMNTMIAAAHLRIAQTQEQRTVSDFKIKSMTTAQLEAALPQAQAGKGPLANLGGLIEERLTTEKQAEINLGLAGIALQKGNRVEYNDRMVDAVTHIAAGMPGMLEQEVAKAQRAGSGVVMLNMGEIDPTTKKPIATSIPVDLVQQGILAAGKVQDEVNTRVAADMSDKLKLMPNVTDLINFSGAFAQMDPRATRLLSTLEPVMKNLDPKNPVSIQQTGLLVKDMLAQRDDIVKEAAAKFTTPEAKAAILNYGKTTKFDSVGGTAVVSDSMGNPSLTTATKYKTAWGVIATAVATELRAQHMTPSLPINGQADSASLLSMIMAKPTGKETVNRITQELLADPIKAAPIKSAIKDNIQTTGINSILYGLASAKGANPVWADLLENTDSLRGADGKVSVGKYFDKLEAQTLLSGNKINYSGVFLDALRNYGINANNSAATDPSYTVQDRALESSIFGAPAQHAVLSDLHYQWRVLATRAHDEMMKRVQKDVSGATQRDAVFAADPMFGEYPQSGPSDNRIFRTGTAEIQKRTGVNLHAVPSATGVEGLTAEQVARMFGGQ